MTKSLKLAALALGVSCAMPALAVDLTAVSFGGANKAAQVKAFYEPFEKDTGNKVLGGEYNGEMAKVKAMVDPQRELGSGGGGVTGTGPWLR
jgi:putative spermidine/putrescine transport system substrate-binding protein